MPLPVKTFIGLGSNIGDRCRYIAGALAAIQGFKHTQLIRLSPMYETPPIGFTEQRYFYNAVCLITTALSPNTLMASLRQVEKNLGRKSPAKRWSPREIDLDILLYGDEQIAKHKLTIPHPELHNRKFAMVPLLDIKDPIHPKLQKRISELMATTKDRSIITRIEKELPINIDKYNL